MGDVSTENGWDLASYRWDELTGVGYFVYERTDAGQVERVEVERPQPAGPHHRGWLDRTN